MGTTIELNDILEITERQGFPAETLNRDHHLKHPVHLRDVEDRIFHFHGKPEARIFQLNPMRVFLAEHTDEGKWLFWGHIVILSLEIRQIEQDDGPHSHTRFEPATWGTSGSFRIIQLYDPEYQKIFTEHEAPPSLNYFGS